MWNIKSILQSTRRKRNEQYRRRTENAQIVLQKTQKTTDKSEATNELNRKLKNRQWKWNWLTDCETKQRKEFTFLHCSMHSCDRQMQKGAKKNTLQKQWKSVYRMKWMKLKQTSLNSNETTQRNVGEKKKRRKSGGENSNERFSLCYKRKVDIQPYNCVSSNAKFNVLSTFVYFDARTEPFPLTTARARSGNERKANEAKAHGDDRRGFCICFLFHFGFFLAFDIVNLIIVDNRIHKSLDVNFFSRFRIWLNLVQSHLSTQRILFSRLDKQKMNESKRRQIRLFALMCFSAWTPKGRFFASFWSSQASTKRQRK